jgi:glycine/D-amino acid oxidase-like deaminating enzyme
MLLPNQEISYWRASSPKSKYPKLQKDLEVDVAVVGGGISGLSAAYLLRKTGLSVAVIEKDTIGAGTTGHTTGKVTSQHNLIYNDLTNRLGAEVAGFYGRANQAATEQIAKIIKTEKIDCQWAVEDNYVFTAEPNQVKQFKAEAKAAAKLGLPASFETKTPLPFEVKAAVKFTNQGYMNAQKYVLGLAASIKKSGGLIFENSRVVYISDGNPGKLRTNHAMVTAKHIIVATNVPTFPLMARGGYCAYEYPHRSYIVAGRLKSNQKGMYISPDKDHYSILPVIAGNEKLLLIGGQNHIPGLKLSAKKHYQKLADYAEAKFGVTEIVYRWSARDYISYDALPLVGKLYPWSSNLYTVTAFRKWGLTNSLVAAEILRDLITDQPNPGIKFFNPHRFRLIASIPRTIAKTFG